MNAWRCTRAESQIVLNREASIEEGDKEIKFPEFQHFAILHAFARVAPTTVINYKFPTGFLNLNVG